MHNLPYDHQRDAANGPRQQRRAPRYDEHGGTLSRRSNTSRNQDHRRPEPAPGPSARARSREDHGFERAGRTTWPNDHRALRGRGANDRYAEAGRTDARRQTARDAYPRREATAGRDRYGRNAEGGRYGRRDQERNLPHYGERGEYGRRGSANPYADRRAGGDSRRGRSGYAGPDARRDAYRRPSPSDRDGRRRQDTRRRTPSAPAKQVDQELGNFISRRITIAMVTLLIAVAAVSVVGRFITANQESEGTFVIDSVEKIATIAESSKIPEDEVISRLEGIGVESRWAEEAAILAQTDIQFQKIAESSETIGDEGPEVSNKLIKLAVSDPEAVNYVANFAAKYPQDEAEPYTDQVQQGTVPMLYQWDERWGYLEYSSTAFGCTGCGPTCMSMVYMAITGSNDMSPGDMAEYANANGFETEMNGTVNDFFPTAAASFGFTCDELDVDSNSLREALDEGKLVICNVGPGDFTDNGHFIVITGLDDDGNLKVNDPFSSVNSSQTWDVDDVIVQTMALYAFK